jgi:hypothetical protein
MRINITGGSNMVYYILKDHLGSASVVTDSTSPTPQTVAEQRYYPYGETRFTSGTICTDKLFTGQRDTGLGIYHYGARFYSQELEADYLALLSKLICLCGCPDFKDISRCPTTNSQL